MASVSLGCSAAHAADILDDRFEVFRHRIEKRQKIVSDDRSQAQSFDY